MKRVEGEHSICFLHCVGNAWAEQKQFHEMLENGASIT